MRQNGNHIILNPKAGNGKAKQVLSALKKLLHSKNNNTIIHLTKARGDATRLAQRLIKAGALRIIAAGGDGTVNEVLNGFFYNGRLSNSECELGIIKCGTGQGLALSLNLPDSLDEQLDLIFNSPAQKLDVGKILYTGFNNQQSTRYFISESQVGIGSVIAGQVHNGFNFLNGKTAFAVVSLKQALVFKSIPFTVTIDDKLFTKKYIGIAFGNGSLTAGGMQVTPGARPDDGLFNVLFIHQMDLLHRLVNLSKMYSGSHILTPWFTYVSGKSIQVDCEHETTVSVDGELIGKTPCMVSVIPSAIKVKSNFHQN